MARGGWTLYLLPTAGSVGGHGSFLLSQTHLAILAIPRRPA